MIDYNNLKPPQGRYRYKIDLAWLKDHVDATGLHMEKYAHSDEEFTYSKGETKGEALSKMLIRFKVPKDMVGYALTQAKRSGFFSRMKVVEDLPPKKNKMLRHISQVYAAELCGTTSGKIYGDKKKQIMGILSEKFKHDTEGLTEKYNKVVGEGGVDTETADIVCDHGPLERHG